MAHAMRSRGWLPLGGLWVAALGGASGCLLTGIEDDTRYGDPEPGATICLLGCPDEDEDEDDWDEDERDEPVPPSSGDGSLERAGSWSLRCVPGQHGELNAVALTATGEALQRHAWVAGELEGECSFVDAQSTHSQNLDAFVGVGGVDPPGSLRVLGGEGIHRAQWIAGHDRGVAVGGEMIHPLTLGPDLVIPPPTEEIAAFPWFASLDPEGWPKWGRALALDPARGELHLTLDPAGRLVVGGDAQQGGDIGLGEPAPWLPAGSRFVAAYHPDGALRFAWSLALAGAGELRLGGLATGPDGEVFVAGSFRGALSLPSGTYLGDNRVFVVALGPEGDALWSAVGPMHPRSTCDVALGADERGRPTVVTSCRDGGLEVVAYGRTGDVRWRFDHHEPNLQQLRAAVRPAGDVVLAATYVDEVSIGRETLPSAGAQDLLIAELSGVTGFVRQARRFGDDEDQQLHGLTVDAGGRVGILERIDLGVWEPERAVVHWYE